MVNREMLSLYFGVGEYISNNSRKGFWGTNNKNSIFALYLNRKWIYRKYTYTG
jgi:hypothetical protein